MGLFSFLKGKGDKVVEEEKAASSDAADAAMAAALRSTVRSYGLDVNDLNIDVKGDKVNVSGEVDTQEIREKVILVLGNVRGVATVEDYLRVKAPPKPEAKFYEVKSGDSLSKIAKEFYGDMMKYEAIFEANKPMLKDPNKIYPGQVLRIPPLEK